MTKANEGDKRRGFPYGILFWAAVEVLMILAAAWMATGCSPRVVEKVVTEHVYHETERVDTLVTKDSVYIREYVKGDTVRITEYRDRYVYRYRDRTDTLAVHDTLLVERETIREVPGKPTPAQKLRMGMGDAMAVLLALLALYLAGHFLAKRLRK